MTAPAMFFGLCLAMAAPPGEPIAFDSPGLPPSRMDAQGRLLEDWGSVGVKLTGPCVTEGPTRVETARLDGLIPCARAVSSRGAVRLTCTAYRAPTHPSGLDVLTVRVEEIAGKPAEVTVALDVPKDAKPGLRTVKLGGRTVITLPPDALQQEKRREWGSFDEATSLRAWAKPGVPCDPAFANIRAGLGGVPIVYRFAVKPGSRSQVVLGFCESHWAQRGQRPVRCRVEGADLQDVDPVARWGQHKPGALSFVGRDANNDGLLDVIVRPGPDAKDRNPILNAIWLFPANKTPKIEQVISGSLNKEAIRYVDCGGDNDQSLYPPNTLEYRLSLACKASKELVFFVACHGGAAPIPNTSPWTPEALHRAAFEVWRDWKP